MNFSRLPICSYPTTTILVDDNERFLMQMNNFLQAHNFYCNFYSDPKDALNFLNKNYAINPFINRCMTVDPDRNIDSFTIAFDFRKIHHEIYNPQRYEQISVIIVDYAMPQQDGLAMCKQINDELSLKLLLTGEVGSSLAVEAFNEGAINKFVRKGALDLPDILIKNLYELQQLYFINLSDAVFTRTINDSYQQLPICLNDPLFITLFNDVCSKNQITEYYLLDEHGSFLMLNAQGKPSWLLVKSETDMQGICEQANEQHSKSHIVRALQSREVIPYFHTESDWDIGYDDEELERYLHAASKLQGQNQVYYYAHIINPSPYQLAWDQIASFEKFLSSKSS
jgi:CheY-like chemotaxis protein